MSDLNNIEEKEIAEYLRKKGWGVFHPSQYCSDMDKDFMEI